MQDLDTNNGCTHLFAGLGRSAHARRLSRSQAHIYIYIYMYVIYIYIYTHTHTYMHACMHACMHAGMHAYIHTYIHAYIHIHTFIYIINNITIIIIITIRIIIIISNPSSDCFTHSVLSLAEVCFRRRWRLGIVGSPPHATMVLHVCVIYDSCTHRLYTYSHSC